MAVVRYQTKLHLPRQGVCSTWLSSLDPADNVIVPVWVKPGTIRFPSDVHVPVIMVGPGRLYSIGYVVSIGLIEF